jgi:hypothetical protein
VKILHVTPHVRYNELVADGAVAAMGGHPCTGHIRITNHSYHHGWASLQRERKLPITKHVKITNHSYHHGWASLPRESKGEETANHRTHNNNQQLSPWVGIPAEGGRREMKQPITDHIKITNHSYHHGCASLQRERQQRGTIRTHYNNQSQLPPWVRIPPEGEATERNNQDTLQ